jgi:hypothetical protein
MSERERFEAWWKTMNEAPWYEGIQRAIAWNAWQAALTQPAAQAVPLTHIQIIELWGNRSDGPDNGELIGFARAIEHAHGIGTPKVKK